MPKKYQLTPIIHLLKDEASVKFHIKSADYFGTIATVLNLLKQRIKKDGYTDAVLNKTLKNLTDDLLFLQKNYEIKHRSQISPRIRNKNNKPKGRLKSQ
ncbi:MAG: hypothetical protein NTY31_03000 [Candidatus Falkowbacteria bacterium]|nr:hypothetical protein [Candidatus Falkowbacteria bacterium]